MKLKYFLLSLATLALVVTSCKNANKKNDEQEPKMEESDSTATEEMQYTAELTALNSEVTDSETSGEAEFKVSNGTMHVTIDVKDAPADMQHWQHFHGFPDGSEANCATENSDENDDDIIDVVETEESSGTTMVPFNENPADMDLGDDTYPEADEDGNYHYEADIPMDKLTEAFADAFDGGEINLDKRVLYIHGVPDDANLPESVESIEDIPSEVTIPIACGKIEKK